MEKKEALDPTLVRDFVANAHGDRERVLDLLAQEPMLINAAWDWGGGDWETALGAASHMGRKDIAHYLLERGARMDIFAAAMLGQVEIVQAILKAFPGARYLRGPHGIPLLNHAKAGGEEAVPVVELLQSLGPV
jgi:Ankyrin repeat